MASKYRELLVAVLVFAGLLALVFSPKIVQKIVENHRRVSNSRSADLLFGYRRVSPVKYSPRTLRRLTKKLRSRDDYTHTSAALQIASMGAPAVEPMIRALSDPNPMVRHGSALALERLKDSRSVDPLLQALSDPSPLVRRGVVDALGKLKDSRVVEPLLQVLRDQSNSTPRHSMKAFTESGNQNAVLPHTDALEESFVRYRIVAALGAIGDRRAVLPLITVLKDTNPLVRSEAADALGRLKDLRAYDALKEMIHDRDLGMRNNAVIALGFLGDPRAVDVLIEVSRTEPNWFVRESTAYGLGNFKDDPRVLGALIDSLDAQSSPARKGTAASLVGFNDPRARALLHKAMQQDKLSVVATAYRFYIEEGAPGTEGTLIMALDRYGGDWRARDYLVCGNIELEEYAKQWLRRWGHENYPNPNSSPPIWGQHRLVAPHASEVDRVKKK